MQLKKVALAVAAVASMSCAHAVDAFPDFKVDSDMASPLTTFTADKITGNYVEVITFGIGNTFTVSLKWTAAAFVANGGIDQLNGGGPGGTNLGNDYALYALFLGSGTFSTVGAVTNFTLTPGGSVNFYYDADLDTTFTNAANGSVLFGTANTSDDLVLASGAAISGTGKLDPTLSTCVPNTPNINCGSFGQKTGFNLTADGKKFFVDPVPFYNVAFQAGQLNNFAIAGTQTINGSLDVVFDGSVPEPMTLGLVGMALLGLGASRRNKA